ncbi:MAG: secretin N-terminal domain-containing protein [Gammaproteobacteria bacterium]
MKNNWRHKLQTVLASLFLVLACAPTAAQNISLAMRDVELGEVMEMLSRQQRVNILLTGEVGGEVSFSLYDMELGAAIRAIASAAGYAVEFRDGSYFIVEHAEAGKYAPDGITIVRSYEIRYADPTAMEQTLTPFLSSYGSLTLALDRRLLVLEDTPEFVRRIERILRDLDRAPQQILIEAKILEVTLDNSDAFGIDWRKLFDSDGGNGTVGTRSLAGDGAGFFFDYATPNVEVALSALRARGRVRTLSTPKLLTVQNQEASVIIGDRRGYQVTTTINQVTTESVEFLESGVILRVRPTVDRHGQVMMDIHPEVSNGTVDVNGVPSQTTTEVTTRLIVPDGQTLFIGGLMKHTLTEVTNGVPVLESLPGVGRLFSNSETTNVNTETIVLITPHVVSRERPSHETHMLEVVDEHESVLYEERKRLHEDVNKKFDQTKVDLSRFGSLRLSPRAQSTEVPSYATPRSAYTLYLFHSPSESDARHFVATHRDTYYAPARDAGRFVIAYGGYAAPDRAQAAVLNLPASITRWQPSVRATADLFAEGG